MALTPGTRVSSYEIVSAIGAGGMGEVYRARDTRLGRAVAIKVLPDALLSDSDRVARLEREAKVLASLHHPRIAVLFGMEEAGGRHFLVMELVEGETLADRLLRGPLPLGEALGIARQIAEGLEAAHEKGIVHRDLKPANVKITPDDEVKVLDFGLAKALETEETPANMANSPTLSRMATQAGLILGTAAYMSPEQAKGFAADRRSDVFSFGIVLYEMLTGRLPFQGETASDVLASILVREPDLTSLPRGINPRLVELLRRCLDKNPKKRWQAVGDLRAEIESIAAAPYDSALQQALVEDPRPWWRRAIVPTASALAAGAFVALGMWAFRAPPAPAAVTRFTIPLDDTMTFTAPGHSVIAMSADGTRIVFAANQRLYVRSLSEFDTVPVPGTEALGIVVEPVFSPDGESIAFWADASIKRMRRGGGAAVTICPADFPFGISWGRDAIVFGQGSKGIMRVSADGGQPELIASVKEGESAHGPQMLPGGDAVLFTVARGAIAPSWDQARIVVQPLKSEPRTLIEGGTDARYLPTGHIVYAHGGVLYAVPFDLRRLQVTGGAVPIIEGVRQANPGATGAAQFSVSRTGSLVYIPGPRSASSAQVLATTDRTGGRQPLNIPPGQYEFPRVSPDGKRIAFGSIEGNDAAIWVCDLSGAGAPRRLTFGGRNRFPTWSGDSKRIAFQSDREGDFGIFWQSADGSDTAERLTRSEPGSAHVPEAWAPQAHQLLFTVTKGPDVSLWTFSLADRKANRFDDVRSSNPIGAVFSPDGHWMAYASRETPNRNNVVYVQPFPPTGAKYQISKSSEDGHHPLWARDGKELFFVPGPGRLVAVKITTEPSFDSGPQAPSARPFTGSAPGAPRPFDLTSDGRFVGLLDPSESQGAPGTRTPPQINVVLNWFEELKQRAPIR